MNVETIGKSTFLTASLEDEIEISLIKENGIPLKVAYRLIRLEIPQMIFVITAECEGEYDGVCIAGDEAYAKRIFLSAVTNQVTPCVLSEVLKDMMA